MRLVEQYPPSMFSFGTPQMANDSRPRPSANASPPPEVIPSGHVDNSLFSPRSIKQLGFFFAGAGFMVASTMITRRAVARKQIAAFPKFYQPSHAAAGKQGNPEGSMIAFEALNLASLNVFSFGLMALGGAAWAFDISSVQELRQRARGAIYGDAGEVDEAAEKEFEEWAARVLTRLGKNPSEDKNQDHQHKHDRKE